MWKLLEAGTDVVVVVPATRWKWEDVGEGKKVSKWGGFVEGIELFDAVFFGVSAREARLMDPQQRMLLECAWEAVEDGGWDPNRLKEEEAAVSVYVGIQGCEYQAVVAKSELRLASCHDQAAIPLTRECTDGALDLAGIAHINWSQFPHE